MADHPERPTPKARTSETLLLLASGEGEQPTVAAIMNRLGDRSFGAIYLLLAIVAFIPSIPGFTGVLGLMLMLVSGQLIFGRRQPWLPAFITGRKISHEAIGGACRLLVPWLRKLETFSRPRLAMLTSPLAERAVGVFVFVLGFVIALPIPFLGNVPPAIAILVFGLGLMERDGLLVLGAFVASAGAIALSGAAGVAAAAHLLRLF